MTVERRVSVYFLDCFCSSSRPAYLKQSSVWQLWEKTTSLDLFGREQDVYCPLLFWTEEGETREESLQEKARYIITFFFISTVYSNKQLMIRFCDRERPAPPFSGGDCCNPFSQVCGGIRTVNWV